jgi:hypothetical protein
MFHLTRILILYFLLNNHVELKSIGEDEVIIKEKNHFEKPTLDENGGVLPFEIDPQLKVENEHSKNLEYGDHFQGDIDLSPEQDQAFNSDENFGKGGRTGQLSTSYRWPKNSQGYVIVPFVIHAQSGYSNTVINE